MKLKYTLIILMLSYAGTTLAESLFKQYKMPALERVTHSSPIKELLYKSKVLKRSQTVSIPLSAINDPQIYQEQLRTEIKNSLPSFEIDTEVVFSGNKISELNSLLRNLTGIQKVKLQGQQIVGDETLSIPRDTVLLGNNSILTASHAQPSILIAANNIKIQDLSIETTGIGVQVAKAVGIVMQNLQLTGVGRGIAILTDSHFIEMNQINIDGPSQGGVLVQGNVSHVWLHNSQIRNGKRSDNGGAGILISDAKAKPIVEETTQVSSLIEYIWPITQSIPYALLIENNILADNRAQGLYVDGGYGLVIQHNQINNNDKEGICLSFGSVNNVVMSNDLYNNGYLARQTDDDLRRDLLFEFGRLADGSAVLKLPAISLDNAAQNLLLWNVIRHNAGDGIKMVRTGIRNIVMFNSIIDNNKGHNKFFHFFGISLGSAGIEAKIDSTKHPLDFMPAIENIIVGNVIYGKHWAGILMEKGAAFNNIYDNIIRFQQLTPLDSTSTNFNTIVGNNWQVQSNNSSWWDNLFE
ncbi:right-handed parallel beta-helix repeat-containing protein [Candidatus Halobeggiatoa sp. HSG11]|nr:right-handed parallel beta-helix repeat-containing protein [Candidatus Halobeggiatoa sp. HSG11]